MTAIAIVSEKQTEWTLRDGFRADYFSCEAEVSPTVWDQYEAVFLMAPYTVKAQCAWTGHPHLRSVSSLAELNAELDCLAGNIECEKKLLIAYPDLQLLEKYHPYASRIEQVYLKSDKATHRIRKRVAGDTVMYFETIKVRTSGMKCFEYENRLTAQQYHDMLSLADENKHPILKTRYCFLYEGSYFELDIYDFWHDKATLELELREDMQPYSLPPELTVIRDVTEDKRYKNNYLAGVTNYEDY